MIKLPDLSSLKAIMKRTLHPRTKWGRVTLWSGGLSVLVYLLGWLSNSGSSAKPGGWTVFFALVFIVCALRLTFRWVRRRVMWRLRYRLIVTYLFIGVIPVLLLLTMVGVSYYLFAGQFADYAAITNLQSALRHLDAENEAMAVRWSSLSSSGQSEKSLADGLSKVAAAMVTADKFPGRTVTAWQGDENFTLAAGGALVKAHSARVPDSIKENFSGFVLDGDLLHLRAVKRFAVGGEQRILISDLPITKELLHVATAHMGSATLVLPAGGEICKFPPLQWPAQTSAGEWRPHVWRPLPAASIRSSVFPRSSKCSTGMTENGNLARSLSSPGHRCCTAPCSPRWATRRTCCATYSLASRFCWDWSS
jgi:hypothetical protein